MEKVGIRAAGLLFGAKHFAGTPLTQKNQTCSIIRLRLRSLRSAGSADRSSWADSDPDVPECSHTIVRFTDLPSIGRRSWAGQHPGYREHDDYESSERAGALAGLSPVLFKLQKELSKLCIKGAHNVLCGPQTLPAIQGTPPSQSAGSAILA